MDSLAAGGTADHLIATNCQLTFVFALFAVANDANGTFCVRATRGCNKVPYRTPDRAPYGCPTVRGSDTSLILIDLPNFCPLFGFDTM